MAASAAYHAWIKDGSPYEDCEPIKDEAVILRKHGYTVWTKGDETHMQANPPQDHTPFSATGWPIKSAYPKGHALDVKDQDEPYPLWMIAEQIIKDKDAKHPGTESIKYINYTDKDGNCWHVSWQPNKAKSESTDKGHLHWSARSDMDDKSTTYDPIARLKEADMADAEELLTSDVVPNRPWREDGKPDSNGKIPNPTVQWQFAITDTWDKAWLASERARRTEIKVTEIADKLNVPTAPLPGTSEAWAALEKKIEDLALKIMKLQETLENLTLKASGGSAPGE